MDTKAQSIKNNNTEVLKEWPGAFGSYKYSRAVMVSNLGPLIAIILIYTFIYGFIYAIILMFDFIFRNSASFYIFFNMVFYSIIYVIGILTSSAFIHAQIQSAKGKQVDVIASFQVVYSKLLNIIIGTILTGLIATASILLLIIPAFFIIPRIYLVLYYIIDQDISPTDALSLSWEKTKGNVGKIYGILGFIFLLSIRIFIPILGWAALIYFGFMYYAIGTVFYFYIKKEKILIPIKK